MYVGPPVIIHTLLRHAEDEGKRFCVCVLVIDVALRGFDTFVVSDTEIALSGGVVIGLLV